MIRGRAVVVIGLAIAVMLSGCVALLPSVGQTPVAEGTPEAEPTPEPTRETSPYIPPGFGKGDQGLATMLVTPDLCPDERPCIDVEVYAYEDCTDGVYVDVDGLDADGVVVDSVRGTLADLAQHEMDRITIVFQQYSAVSVVETGSGCF